MNAYFVFGDIDEKFAKQIAEKERKTGKGFFAKLKREKPEEIEYIDKFYIPVQCWIVSYSVEKGLIRKKMEAFTKELYIIPTNPKIDVRDMVIDFEDLTKNYGMPTEAEVSEEHILPQVFDFPDYFEDFKNKVKEKLSELEQKVNDAVEEYKKAHEDAKFDIEEAWSNYKEYQREKDPDFRKSYYADYKAAMKSAKSTLDRGKKAYERAFKELQKYVDSIRKILGEIFGKDAKSLIDVKEPEKYSVKLPGVTYKVPTGPVDLRNDLDEISIDKSDKFYLIPVYIAKYTSEKGTRYIVISRKGKDKFLQKFIESESVINFLP